VRPASNDETAVLFFTSGTTGLPKGAELSHDAVTVYFRHHGRFFSLLPRIPNHLGLLVMPVAHAGGYAVMMVQLIIGIPAYFLSRFDAGAILDTIEDHHPTIFSGTPAMFRMLVDSAGLDRDLGSVRIWSGGADAFSDGLISTFRGRWARRGLLGITRKPMFIRGYGMAETNTYLAQTPPFACGDNCLGWVLPPVQYRIVDPEGNDVRRGEQGELWVRGPNVAKRYWEDEGSTARAFTDGWFRTGDLVRQGRWRMLYFVGRSQEVIKTGGYKVSAVELDHVIGRHPDVEQVATVGVPDDVKGEVPVAAVVLRDGADTPEQEILEHAKRHLAPYKRPRRVIFLRAIPVTFNLKPRRLEVKGKILEHLGAEAGEERRGA
jgi:acyl-CoA synthetase (AMP-forming)/AMP-acid ligase II